MNQWVDESSRIVQSARQKYHHLKSEKQKHQLLLLLTSIHIARGEREVLNSKRPENKPGLS